MCRLALIDQKGIKYIEENYSLINLFNYLQKSFGGHGNGICIVTKDNNFYIEKGIKLSNKTIVEIINSNMENLKWVIYHTRLASVGGISNNNCHPFKLRNKALCMNGTEFWARKTLDILNLKTTDTELILRLAGKNLYSATKRCNSVFIGMEDGKVFANRNIGDLKYFETYDGGKVFASDFPNNILDSEQIYISPKYWIEGNKINKSKLMCINNKKDVKTKYDYSFKYL